MKLYIYRCIYILFMYIYVYIYLIYILYILFIYILIYICVNMELFVYILFVSVFHRHIYKRYYNSKKLKHHSPWIYLGIILADIPVCNAKLCHFCVSEFHIPLNYICIPHTCSVSIYDSLQRHFQISAVFEINFFITKEKAKK